jgi:hypothetical protein
MGKVAALCGDPFFDWLTEEYFSPLCQTAYDMAIQNLEGTCAPYIEKVVVVPAVQLGVDENNLVTSGAKNQQGNQQYPLGRLVKPRYVDFKLPNTPANQFKPAKEFSILPDSVTQITAQTYDIRVRGDFLPAPLTTDDSILEIHPNAAHALAFSVMALIGAERPNDGWTQKFTPLAEAAWEQIADDLQRQQQRLTFRIGSPNRQGERGICTTWNLQGTVGWEWRSYGLYLKLL